MLADGMSHSAEMDQSAIETVSTINITVSSEISTVDITSEMKAFFDSSWEADTFVSKIDWFVKLTKDGFCGLFLAQFKLFAKRTGLLDTKKGEFLRNFKLNMRKILMTTIASSNTWTFKSKSSHEKIIVDIFFISHAIVDRKIDAYVFDLFKFEGSKSCEACNDMKEQLDEQLSILKALKFSHEKLAGMVNKLNNSNFFKSFNYHNEEQQGESASSGAVGPKRKRTDDTASTNSGNESRLETLTGTLRQPVTNFGDCPQSLSGATSRASSNEVSTASPSLASKKTPSSSTRNSYAHQSGLNLQSRPAQQRVPSSSARPPAPSEQSTKRDHIDTRKNKNRKPNIYIVGKATDGNGNIKTVARKFHYIIGRIAINTDPSLIKTFLADKIKSEIVIESIPLKHDYFKLLKLSVDETYDHVMRDPMTWPVGIAVKRFFFRPRSNSDERSPVSFSLTKPHPENTMLSESIDQVKITNTGERPEIIAPMN